jgi:hypothetical protein
MHLVKATLLTALLQKLPRAMALCLVCLHTIDFARFRKLVLNIHRRNSNVGRRRWIVYPLSFFHMQYKCMDDRGRSVGADATSGDYLARMCSTAAALEFAGKWHRGLGDANRYSLA